MNPIVKFFRPIFMSKEAIETEDAEQRRQNTNHNTGLRLANLPPEVFDHLGSYLDSSSLTTLRQTCSLLRTLVDTCCHVRLRSRMIEVVVRAGIYVPRESQPQSQLHLNACLSANALRNRHRTAERDALRARVERVKDHRAELASSQEAFKNAEMMIVATLSPITYGLTIAKLSGANFERPDDNSRSDSYYW